jgi:hypothetical protein
MRTRSLLAVATACVAAALVAYGVSCVDSGTMDTTCPTYCTQVAAVCTGTAAQYPTTDMNVTCLHMCGAMEAGAPGVGGSNTVACRNLSISNAKDDPANLYVDCVNGGVSAANCPTDQCTAFCTLDLALCGSGMTGYPDIPTCVTTCKTWDPNFAGMLIGSTGNSLECRTYHLELSQTGNPADLAVHCPHTGAVSARCTNSGMDGGTEGGMDAAGD